MRISSELRRRMISCEFLKSPTELVDIEKDVYAAFAQNFVWNDVDKSVFC